MPKTHPSLHPAVPTRRHRSNPPCRWSTVRRTNNPARARPMSRATPARMTATHSITVIVARPLGSLACSGDAQPGFGPASLFVRVATLSALKRLLGSSHVDLVGQFGDLRKDRHRVVRYG